MQLKHPEVLVRLKKHLRNTVSKVVHPKVHFDMAEWAYKTKEADWSFPLLAEPRLPHMIPEGVCGAAMCFAGHIVISEKTTKEVEAIHPFMFERAAEALLFGRGVADRTSLFFLDSWPLHLQGDYERAKKDSGRVEVAIRVIDWYLENEGFTPQGKPLPQGEKECTT